MVHRSSCVIALNICIRDVIIKLVQFDWGYVCMHQPFILNRVAVKDRVKRQKNCVMSYEKHVSLTTEPILKD